MPAQAVDATPVSGHPRRKVAIACQGGGAHTAFTAGALTRLLERYFAGAMPDVEIVGLSGTSGGAICATLAWAALLAPVGERAGRLARLREFWLAPYPAGNVAATPFDLMMNMAAVALTDFPVKVSHSPYHTETLLDLFPGLRGSPMEKWVDAREALRSLLELHVDFAGLRADMERLGGPGPGVPELFVGAAGVVSGGLRAFAGSEAVFGPECVLASACLPELMTAQTVPGVDRDVYWDGLFSQNPPLTPFLEQMPLGNRPDEMWIVRINPLALAGPDDPTPIASALPTSVKDIADRRNEMSGNLSLEQEKAGIERINRIVDAVAAAVRAHPTLAEAPGIRCRGGAGGEMGLLDYKRIDVVEAVAMSPAVARSLGIASKFDRGAAFLEGLYEDGLSRAGAFADARGRA